MSIQRPSSYRRFSTTDTRKTVQSDKITRINDLLDGIIGEYVNGNEFNKLTYLSDIKFAIASAIKAKGKSVDSDPFMNYANKIAELENNDNSIAKINDLLDEIIGESISGNEFNKLDYLSDIKRTIAEAIQSKGKTISSADPFMSYADKVAALEGNNSIIAKINRFIGVCFTTESIKKVTLTEVTE